MKSACRFVTLASLSLVALSQNVRGQWSRNPAVNTLVQSGAVNSDQNQPKILPASDGGAYVIWLDGIGSGWDTRVQRLDSRGRAMWPSGGTLVADTSFSSTEDYGFAVDVGNNVLVAYRESGSPFTIEAQKVAADGSLLWNPAGVQLSTVGSNAPHACATSDGGMIAAWTESGVAKVQKIDGNGAIQWTAGGVSDTAGVGSYSVSDVVSDNAGGAIVLYVNITGTITAPKHLRAQRFSSADGSKLWNGGTSLAVFDGGSLQIANFPSLLADGAGCFIVAWYEVGNARNAWVQHVDVNGTEAFPHNGVSIGNPTGTNIRIAAAAAHDASTGDIYLFAIEANSGQSQWHIIGQRIDEDGVRAWASPLEFTPLAAQQPSFLQAQPTAGGAMAFWFQSSSVQSAAVNSKGAFAWTPGILAACSNPGGKARLSSCLNASGTQAMLAWSDARNAVPVTSPSERDIFVQNVRLDGSLGLPGDANSSGEVDVDDLIAVILGWGTCPAAPAFCEGDVVSPPRGNGAVDVDDLIAVILNWG